MNQKLIDVLNKVIFRNNPVDKITLSSEDGLYSVESGNNDLIVFVNSIEIARYSNSDCIPFNDRSNETLMRNYFIRRLRRSSVDEKLIEKIILDVTDGIFCFDYVLNLINLHITKDVPLKNDRCTGGYAECLDEFKRSKMLFLESNDKIIYQHPDLGEFSILESTGIENIIDKLKSDIKERYKDVITKTYNRALRLENELKKL